MNTTTLIPGNHYFAVQSRRTDPFRGKRYTDPRLVKTESLVVMGRFEEQRGEQVKLLLGGNEFEKDGESYIFGTSQLLVATDGAFRCLEVHGKPPAELGQWFSASA